MAGSIYDAIRAIAGDGGSAVCDTGVARNVDADQGVCDVEIEGKSPAKGALIGNADSGVMTVPKEGSVVAVVWASPVTAVVVMVSEVEEIRLMGGQLGGLVKVEELKKSLESLKDYCESLKSAVSSGLAAVGVGSAASGTTGKTTFETAMAAKSIKIEELENEKVKQ